MKIKRWGTYLVNLNPAVGTKPAKKRPVLVIQSDTLNDDGHLSTVILPISSRTRKTDNALPLCVPIPAGEAGLVKDSVILVDQILTWDNRFFMSQLGFLSDKKIKEVTQAFQDFFEGLV